jgi:hypothetical protein
MKASKTAPGLLVATIAIFALLTSAAEAEYLVPPGNSAATQYTEAVPTAGGPKASNNSRHGGGKSPKQVLGHRNAQKLDAQGPEGRAAAEVAAATAPTAVSSGDEGTPATQPRAPSGSAPDSSGAGGSSSNGGAPGGHRDSGRTGRSPAGRGVALASEQIPSGSSGLGQVLGQATGASSSEQLGLLLPLVVLGAIAWSIAFVLRRRRQPTH